MKEWIIKKLMAGTLLTSWGKEKIEMSGRVFNFRMSELLQSKLLLILLPEIYRWEQLCVIRTAIYWTSTVTAPLVFAQHLYSFWRIVPISIVSEIIKCASAQHMAQAESVPILHSLCNCSWCGHSHVEMWHRQNPSGLSSGLIAILKRGFCLHWDC